MNNCKLFKHFERDITVESRCCPYPRELSEFCEDKNSQTRVGLVLASGNNVAVQGFERKVARVCKSIGQ